MKMSLVVSTFMGLLSITSFANAESKESAQSSSSAVSEIKNEKKSQEGGPQKGNAPLYFAVDGTSFTWKRSGISYDFRKTQEIEVGGHKINANSFQVSAKDGGIALQWDATLVRGGQLSVFDKLGNTVLTQDVSGSEATLSKETVSKWTDQQRLRFCVKSSEGREFSSLCSAWYGIGLKADSLNLKELKGEAASQLIIQNEERAKKSFIEVSSKEVVQFFVRLKNEMTYEFVAQVPAVEVLDLVKAGNEKSYQAVFVGGQPLVEKMEEVKNPLYSRKLPVNAKLWNVKIPEKQNSLSFQGDEGGIFTFDYDVQNPPAESARLYISEKFQQGTYNKKDRVSYRSESGQGKWDFQSPEQGWGRVEGEAGSGEHKAYLDIYRGKPAEVGLRVAALMTTQGEQAIVGEGYAGYWFNNFLGSDNYYFARQRWGIGLSYLSALTQLSTDNTDDVKYSNLSALLKYKVKPGIAYHDSSWGLQVGYTQSVVGDFDVPLLGAGLFWSSQLPTPIENLLEKIPFFRKTKWIGIEGLYNFSSLDSEVALDGSFVLSGYLRTFINNSAYWELSGGYRDNSFTRDNGAAIKLNTVIGSIGLGMSF